MTEILKVTSREILDSRGNPTIEAEVTLSDGSVGCASVPSGASRGQYEAHEKRDCDPHRHGGKGVLGAVSNVSLLIAPALSGMDAYDIYEADSVMIALDGVYNKSNLGANAILSVSLALCRAAAASLGLPLYRYLGGALRDRLPVPMMNILNGGKHSDNNIDIQEFMIVPSGAESFSEGVRICSEIYHALGSILRKEGLSSSVGDEGGYAPSLDCAESAFELILRAGEECGYKPKKDFSLAVDAAASEWYTGESYLLPKSGKRLYSGELADYFISLTEKYPIISLEDPMADEDTDGWKLITERLGGRGVMLVGDDLFVTDPARIMRGAENGTANSVLIKPNQIGTVTECAEAVLCAKSLGMRTVLSHRSGDTEDTFIADLAVALGADYIKTGAPARAERTSKYNRLMKIESELFSPEYGERRINGKG